MPVRKFRNLQDMEDSLWRQEGTPELFAAIARVWDFAERTCARRFPPGVHKHRSLEQAQEQRERWDEENFRSFWKNQNASPR